MSLNSEGEIIIVTQGKYFPLSESRRCFFILSTAMNSMQALKSSLKAIYRVVSISRKILHGKNYAHPMEVCTSCNIQ